jgi:hypothetical protein
MQHFKKAWVRALVAFLLGGVLREAIFISTGDPNRPRGKNYDVITLGCVAGVYILLTLYVKSRVKKEITS